MIRLVSGNEWINSKPPDNNRTWDLAQLRKVAKSVGCKWVYEGQKEVSRLNRQDSTIWQWEVSCIISRTQ